MRRAAFLVVITLAASMYSRASAASCRYSHDFEGEDRSWVGWSPEKVGYRDDNGQDQVSWMIVSTQTSLTIPVGVACGTPQHGEFLMQLLPSMNLQFTMISDHSSAVLPPSFNPRILRASFRYRWWPGANGFVYPNGSERALGMIVSGWSHHSNGQYAPTYFDVKDAPTEVLQDAVKANLDNGDFATNYVSGKVWFRCSALDDDGNRPKQGLFASVEYQFHHGVLPGHLPEKLRPIWGQHHVLFSALYRTGYQHDPMGGVAPTDSFRPAFANACRPGYRPDPNARPKGSIDLGGTYWLVSADAWWVIDAETRPVVSSRRWRGALEAAWFIPKYLGPAGVFVRGDMGRNPLNIRFVENRGEIIFGVMLDTSQSIERLP